MKLEQSKFPEYFLSQFQKGLCFFHKTTDVRAFALALVEGFPKFQGPGTFPFSPQLNQEKVCKEARRFL